MLRYSEKSKLRKIWLLKFYIMSFIVRRAIGIVNDKVFVFMLNPLTVELMRLLQLLAVFPISYKDSILLAYEV